LRKKKREKILSAVIGTHAALSFTMSREDVDRAGRGKKAPWIPFRLGSQVDAVRRRGAAAAEELAEVAAVMVGLNGLFGRGKSSRRGAA
jgi:hypothetical protein